jgi:hypothetical protein
MLELYLMGLVPAEEVPAHQVLVDPREFRFTEEGNLVVKAKLDTVTIGDIIESDGRRVPGFDDSPKAFTMATVVVSDRPLNPVELSYHERQAEWFGSDVDSETAFAAATGFRATMDTRLEPTATAVLAHAGAADSVSPSVPELAQNYPNPFNGNTILGYRLPQVEDSAPVIEIFAANGQRLRRIAVQDTESEFGQVMWDGTDDEGLALATGVYFAVLKAADAVAARKLTLVR